jgi:hypothetical protein
MAKRVYTPKAVSPEVAREAAISKAESAVLYAQRDVKEAAGTIEQWTRRGISEVDGVTMADLERRAARATEELARAEAALTAVLEG